MFLINMIMSQQKFGIVIHGGAGNILPEHFSKELEEAYHQKMQEALQAGYSILEKGGNATDAVVAAIKIMEDSPLFNAGKGSVYNNKGQIEMDASIMEGKELKAGSVAGVRRIKNPIEAARLVMEQTPHVMMVGKGAEDVWVSKGNALIDTNYFYDEKKLKQWKEKQKSKTDKHGTVGAVALDKNGNLAAGTSTGGMMDKLPGRVGDSPIIGAGTYANNNTCAISCTGHGEFFIRYAVAHSIHSKMFYANQSLQDATHEILFNELLPVGGTGGIIGIDKNGNFVMDFNTTGMYRGYWLSSGEKGTFIFKSNK
ncbi:MAG TPA: isoaspartyl peptidase/L-asparaginase [Bacteroidia bacterium]|nr:isoaspartyl peptidase/L-asparaginase [Bacteroidia bacterium]